MNLDALLRPFEDLSRSVTTIGDLWALPTFEPGRDLFAALERAPMPAEVAELLGRHGLRSRATPSCPCDEDPDGILALQCGLMALPRTSWPGFLSDAFALGIGADGWGVILAQAWVWNAFPLVQAAGSRERVDAWFRLASRSRAPLARELLGADPLPESLVLYRGGRARRPGEVAQGLCWTPFIGEAAFYAQRHSERGPESTIVSRTVSPGEVSCQFAYGGRETIVPFSGDFAPVTTSPTEIMALYLEVAGTWAARARWGRDLVSRVAADPAGMLLPPLRLVRLPARRVGRTAAWPCSPRTARPDF